jgi:2-oxoisovalerate dehydrogenase E1 component
MSPSLDWPLVARLLLTSRAIDRVEEVELAPAGKVAYQFSARGHELAQILLGLALEHPHDGATVYYRSRAFMLSQGLTAQAAFAADLARTGSPSEGRDVGVVFSLARAGRETQPGLGQATVLPSSGAVGAQYTPAAGWAQAIGYRQRVLGEEAWTGAISVALGGDGSVAANGFWSALNIATTLRLPMLFFIEDNAYGISVAAEQQTPGGNIAANLATFGNLLVLDGDGADPEETPVKIAQAVKRIRSGEGPCLLRVVVPRLSGHSFVDNQAYKPPEVRVSEDERDPLPRLRKALADKGILGPGEWTELETQVNREVEAARDAAWANAEPDPATAVRHVFFEAKPQLVGGLLAETSNFKAQTSNLQSPITNYPLPIANRQPPAASGPRINMLDAIRRTLEAELAANPRVLIFGEDVGLKGGVHGATLDLQLKFGPERVLDTSLSEEGIIGRAVGLALAGLLPVPEIQFRKYADPATEQINDCGWIRWRTVGKFAAPMVVRIPVGYGKKTGDPWHSVTGEAVFAHAPGWRIAFPSNAEDAVGLLRSALRGNDPTMFFEHRALLDTAPARRRYPGDEYAIPFGKAAILAQGDELSVITWGEMVYRCVAAAEPYAGRVEIVDLRTIVPWDSEAVLASIRKTGKCLIVHEDTRLVGFGAEIAATIAQGAFTDLDAPIERVASADCPIPYNASLMSAVVPSVDVIRARITQLLEF